MAKLSIETPDGSTTVHELVGTVVLGRVAASGLPIADRKMSREHCRLSQHLGAWQITDLGSSNGTRVNGVAVQKRLLEHGDRIEVGLTKIRFEAEEKKVVAPVLTRRESARTRLRKKR